LKRQLASNYWICPIPYYSHSVNDYSTAKSQCGQFIFFILTISKTNKIDASCTNRCLNNGKCSMKLNGNFDCECSLPSFGAQCESGSCFIYFFWPFIHSLLKMNKNRRVREK